MRGKAFPRASPCMTVSKLRSPQCFACSGRTDFVRSNQATERRWIAKTKRNKSPRNMAPFFRNLPSPSNECHSGAELMPQSRQADIARRAPRVKLAGTILALLRLESGRQIRARLHQLSFTGGLLHLEKPLDEGIKVEVMFHVGGSTVRSKASMLFPMWATQGCLQPFEFTGLGEEDRRNLEADLQRFLGSTAVTSCCSEDVSETAPGSDQ